ncbi:hypothetical protein AMJ85_01425 [candidate division BRC1 bacterium SM23_51]|nr:MAG: hypothetical protein AMJ85_01425 [candidate division BRC1 bacterium SM23_51]
MVKARMDEQEPRENEIEQGEDIAALEIVGGFLMILGCAMVVAVFWPPTPVGKITNLIVAVILLGVGLGMFLRGRSVRKTPRHSDRDTASGQPVSADKRAQRS